jgi:acetyl-CoA carboxylase carboxyltransferase component
MKEHGWGPEIDALRSRQADAREMGGTEKVAIQRSKGKLTVRERLDAILDPGTFREVGSIAGAGEYDDQGRSLAFAPANFIFGRGRVNGRVVVVTGDDFTVRGGSADAAITEKLVQAEQMGNELRLPIVRLIDGAGGSVKMIESAGYTYVPANPAWNWVVDNLATVPVVSLGLGPVAGLNAARLVSSHYSVLVNNIGLLFAAGPAVVSAAVNQKLSKETLGSAEMHARSGTIDDVAVDEREAFAKARRFLSYLPSSVYQLPERVSSTDSPDRSEEWLDAIVPRDRRQVYKMRRILEGVLDHDSFFEIGQRWGRSAITGFGRLDGWPIAVIASDPMIYGGAWTYDAAQKLTRFIELAETFHLPVAHFVDVPGFLVGLDAEKAGTIRHGARALASVYQATVPWCTIIVRKAFGVAGASMANHTRFRYRYAWPSGDWGSLPIEGGIEVAYKSNLAASANPEGLLREIQERLNRSRSPFLTAEKFLVEEIIAPRETRSLLCEFANLAAPLRKAGRSAFSLRP